MQLLFLKEKTLETTIRTHFIPFLLSTVYTSGSMWNDSEEYLDEIILMLFICYNILEQKIRYFHLQQQYKFLLKLVYLSKNMNSIKLENKCGDIGYTQIWQKM